MTREMKFGIAFLIAAFIFAFSIEACSQFVLVENYPYPATDIHFDGDDMYVAIQDGRLYKNGELLKTYDTKFQSELGFVAVCVVDGDIYAHVTSSDGRYQNFIVNDDTLISVDYLNNPPTSPPYSLVHRGGDIVAYEDNLYVSFGMGTFSSTSQDDNDYRGKIIQIKPVEKLVAKGLRNPFRFDRGVMFLWVTDVGEHLREEISLIEDYYYNNLGWPYYEGNYEHYDTSGVVYPSYEYAHHASVPASITGGVLHEGAYYFCDHYSGDGGKLHTDSYVEFMDFPQYVTSMDVRNDSLFILTWDGRLYSLNLKTTSVNVPGRPPYNLPNHDSKKTRYFDLQGREIFYIDDNYIINGNIIYGIINN